MSRRAPLALILALSTATTAVACGSSDSTPASTPSSTVATVDLRSDSFTLTADRREGLTVLSEESDSISVEIPDDALPSGVDSADITATVNRLTATDVGTAIEFELGPDGTEFDEPVTLTWTADWDPEAPVAVSAIADDGTNLLSADDTEEILKTLQVVPNDDGTSTISVDIDHFSVWSFFSFPGAGSTLAAQQGMGGYLLLSSYEDNGTVVVAADVLERVKQFMSVTTTELCLEVSELSYGGVKSDKGSEVVEDGFRKCTTDNFIDLTMPTTCDGTGQGFMRGMSTAYFGLAGLSPFALLIVLAGGDVQSQATAFSQSDSWASASKALLFIRRKFDQNIPCAPPTTMSTAMSTTTMTDSDTPLAQPTTTVRSGTSGSPSRTTTLAPTTTTAPSTTTTTTTIKATTTTRPRAGATTTLPRPTPGGTTTLP